jgi:hypothetical protein
MQLWICLLLVAACAAKGLNKAQRSKDAAFKPMEHERAVHFNERFAANSKKHSVKSETNNGFVVGAQLNCHGYLCPQWELKVSRWNMDLPEDNELQLVQLLPLAPTFQRNQPVFTDYDSATRTFTVGVQNYPSNGVDTFFQVAISDDIGSAKIVQDNVIVGHPDASVNNPGSLTMLRMFDSPDPNGGLVVIFDDGNVYNLDLVSKQYTLIANIKSDPSVKALAVSQAHVFDGLVLKSFLHDTVHTYQNTLVTLDISSKTLTKPVALSPVQGGGMGIETPLSAHMTKDPNTDKPVLTLMLGGQFDQIIQVDENTGAQVPTIFSITQGAGVDENYPSIFYCDTNTKDCDYWTTSTFDPVSNQLFAQAHFIDDQDVYWTSIYKQYWLKQAAGTFAYWSPVTLMNFGYSGYQFVAPAAGKAAFMPAPQDPKAKEAERHAHHEKVVAARKASAAKVQLSPEEASAMRAQAKRKLQSKAPTGTIVSAQFWKSAQGAAHELRITATYPVTQIGVDNDVNLQTLLPAALDSNGVFTAYCPDSRNFFVAVDNYPRAGYMTAWASTLSAKADAATPVYTAVEIKYLDSSSPAPLNIITPTIARLLHVEGKGLLAVFQNGEVHSVDLANKKLTKVMSIISDEDLYSTAHPYVTSAQVVSTDSKELYSFIFSASNVFLATIDLAAYKAGAFVGPLDMPGTQDLSTGFSPETLINAHMISTADAPTPQLYMMMESLDSVGFDEINMVNTTTGELQGPMYNLMEDYVVFECFNGAFNCDKWRNSVYAQAEETLYFQSHDASPGNTNGVILSAMVRVNNHVTGKYYWVVNPEVEMLSFGYTGMTWVTFAQ